MSIQDTTDYGGAVGPLETTTANGVIAGNLGISSRALSIAREVDRLPAGQFCIILVKHGVKAVPWHAVVHKMEKIAVMDVKKG
jgi:hypothetical protein